MIIVTASACTTSSDPPFADQKGSCNTDEEEDSRYLRLPDCFKHHTRQEIADRCRLRMQDLGSFVGIGACYETLPQKELTGSLVLGFEHQEFFPSPEKVVLEYGHGGAAVLLGEQASSKLDGLPHDGKLRVFHVRFVGAYSEVPGIYGPGQSRGVYIKNIDQLEDLTGKFQELQ